jgi:methylated-DNA-protein-cysteine methyltransferase-like protein
MPDGKIPLDEQIYRVVCLIPEGKVATYGQIAKLAGLEGRARRVGYALRTLGDARQVPWHRVVNARGQISRRGREGASEQTQYLRLRAEGIQFRRNGRLSLSAYSWRP